MTARGARLDRERYELVFAEDFTDPDLRADRWVPHYLPHWTTPERSAARYDTGSGVLRLRVDADQPAWRTQDGEMRVSNLQTGVACGPVGSPLGQHRHRPDLAVVTAVPTRRLFTPTAGLVEAELRAPTDPTCMLALWLVGLEADGPELSGELCVAELYGSAVGPARSAVRMGVKAHGDPRLHDDMTDEVLDLDASQWHRYGVAWSADGADFLVDDRVVRSVGQRLDYELTVMVDLFEFPLGPDRPASAYPKTAEVRDVRGWRRAGA